jgi:alkylation response protein AidB-like acyl-CoA dehydrogenase
MDSDRSYDLTSFSSACKCFASDTAMQVTTDPVQLLGGYGYAATTRVVGVPPARKA